jgi:hypothetical protein
MRTAQDIVSVNGDALLYLAKIIPPPAANASSSRQRTCVLEPTSDRSHARQHIGAWCVSTRVSSVSKLRA